MSVAEPVPRRDVDPLPDELESAQAKLVYLYLDAAGGGMVADLQETLGIPKIALLSVLDALDGRGIVEREGDRYRGVATHRSSRRGCGRRIPIPLSDRKG